MPGYDCVVTSLVYCDTLLEAALSVAPLSRCGSSFVHWTIALRQSSDPNCVVGNCNYTCTGACALLFIDVTMERIHVNVQKYETEAVRLIR